MHCPRLKHFIRLNHTGKFGKCGHMVDAHEFDTANDMQNSQWLGNINSQMEKGQWPKECIRCQLTEQTSNTSIRLDMIERDRILRAVHKDYLIVGGVLDNVCNSACQSCNATLSTKIGSLENKNYKKINNYELFFQLPQDRIIELDVNGGEPTASPNYKKLLKNLPASVKIVRINTNGSKIIPEVLELLTRDTKVIITLSFDGTGLVHDYARWPIKWNDYKKNVFEYLKLREQYKNLRLNSWTTVSCLNVGDLDNIVEFARQNNLDHAYGFCLSPSQLDVRYENKLTVDAKKKLSSSKNKVLQSISETCCSLNKNNSLALQSFIRLQDKLRKISFKDYFNFDPKAL